MGLTLASVVAELGGELHGDGQILIEDIAPLDAAGPQAISFLSHPRYVGQLANSSAACVVVSPAQREAALARGACILTDQPYLYYARLSQLWKRQLPQPAAPAVHPSAVIDPGAHVDATARIGPLCVIERGARIGAHTELRSRVTLGADCVVGERCLLHAGVVIGADGFGFAPDAGHWTKIEQLGAVRIGNDVEIGANTCVDRGALRDTVIEDGVKLDNLIQIGHNVRVGAHSALAGCVGVAGSAVIGAHCTVGGGAIVLGHLELADHVHISAATVVTRSIRKSGNYTGMYPLDENAVWEKNAATLKHLHQLRERVRALEGALKGSESP